MPKKKLVKYGRKVRVNSEYGMNSECGDGRIREYDTGGI
jgi:hypothetical protein